MLVKLRFGSSENKRGRRLGAVSRRWGGARTRGPFRLRGSLLKSSGYAEHWPKMGNRRKTTELRFENRKITKSPWGQLPWPRARTEQLSPCQHPKRIPGHS